MEKLIKLLDDKIEKSKEKEGVLSADYINNLYSFYPFNKFEFIISHLIAEKLISIDDYYDLRNNYLERNKYLYLYEINAPRTFGETWAQRHLNELVPELKKPNKKLDPDYNGEYDFWYNGIKIEVKASRAVKRDSGESLIEKALGIDSDLGFDMNFQQLKPGCANVFVWIAVWRDAIKYWVLSSDEVKTNSHFSPSQHRGNKGEGQLWIKESNIKEFDKYLVSPRDLLEKIIEKSDKKK